MMLARVWKKRRLALAAERFDRRLAGKIGALRVDLARNLLRYGRWQGVRRGSRERQGVAAVRSENGRFDSIC